MDSSQNKVEQLVQLVVAMVFMGTSKRLLEQMEGLAIAIEISLLVPLSQAKQQQPLIQAGHG